MVVCLVCDCHCILQQGNHLFRPETVEWNVHCIEVVEKLECRKEMKNEEHQNEMKNEEHQKSTPKRKIKEMQENNYLMLCILCWHALKLNILIRFRTNFYQFLMQGNSQDYMLIFYKVFIFSPESIMI